MLTEAWKYTKNNRFFRTLLAFYYIIFLTIKRICCIFYCLILIHEILLKTTCDTKKKPLFLFVNNKPTYFCFSRHNWSGTAELTLIPFFTIKLKKTVGQREKKTDQVSVIIQLDSGWRSGSSLYLEEKKISFFNCWYLFTATVHFNNFSYLTNAEWEL